MKTLLTLILLAASPALAVQNVGNGGAVVKGTCDGVDPTLEFTELLDFFEVKYYFGITPELGAPELSVDAKVEMALDRLARLDPERADLYRDWFGSFEAESKDHQPLMPFPPLRDAGDTSRILRSGCQLEKIIDQSEPTSSISTKRYLIKRPLFDALDNDTQAGLILHELFYRDALLRGHATSIKARVITGLFASRETESWTAERYQDVMTEYGFNGYMLRYSRPFLIRYFDHAPMTLAEATAYCAALPGDSALASLSDLDVTTTGERVTWRESVIALHIVGDDGAGSASFWLKDGKRRWSNDDLFASAQAEPDEQLPFICRQEFVKSPWTEQR
jgi:hypothetical protein